MQSSTIRLRYLDLIKGLSEAVDLINPAVSNHHRQVSLITWMFCKVLDYNPKRTRDLVIAAALHDIGGLSLQERLDALQFEIKHPHQHSENGYLLLKDFPALKLSARLIRFHHVSWDNGKGRKFMGHMVPYDSQVLHLADRVAVLISKNQEILGQVKRITDVIASNSSKLFDPKLVSMFQEIAQKEYFWLELDSTSSELLLGERLKLRQTYLKTRDVSLISRLFSHIIDFRSHFTATHSSGVAAVAHFLAISAGLTEAEAELIRIAGYLHDLGKLAVPAEILEKPGKLTEEEFNIIRKHTYYTHYLLLKIGLPLETIHWAAYHHENLSGHGYPFHVDDPKISFPARIMAVADVFTALTEDRPYRLGMNREETISVLNNFVESRKLDSDIVALLISSFKEINQCRRLAQADAVVSYLAFKEQML